MEVFLTFTQLLLGYLQTIRITDVLDIAIISYLLFRLLMLAKHSNAGQVMKGLGLLIVVMWLANLFRLNILSYLLNNALEVGLVAVIVVFQPEIRRFLSQMGSSERFRIIFGRDEQGDDMEATIEQIVDAYASMSKDKIGALTVFERGNILEDYLKTGTAFDAQVSSELVKNIFWPKAPMHDGAMIIRNGRIAGAGCVLPLSGNTSISRELGMRHRAGIGTTEVTDALVVICSEETGSISVATNGALRRHLAPETLRRLLRTELLPNSDEHESKAGAYWVEKLSSLNWNSIVKAIRSSKDQPNQAKEQSDHVE